MDVESELSDLRSRVEALEHKLASKSARPYWQTRAGLTMTSVRYIGSDRTFLVRLADGHEFRLPRETVPEAGAVASVRRNRDGTSARVRLKNGKAAGFSSGFVLYNCDAQYRAWMDEQHPKALPGEYGARIRTLREAQGRTAVEVATAAGMAKQNYGRIESGKHVPTIDTFMRIARTLGVPVSRLLAADATSVRQIVKRARSHRRTIE